MDEHSIVDSISSLIQYKLWSIDWGVASTRPRRGVLGEYSDTPYFGCYDPLWYPLFFPNGESGWHPNITCEGISINEVDTNQDNINKEMEESNTQHGRKTVAIREYYCNKFQIQSIDNVLLFGGRLIQQFFVDVYIKLEASRLQFCELNQAKIRADLYQGTVDCVDAVRLLRTELDNGLCY
ncbi:hypothetical protein E3N88_00561 [Mikania micrantha]|uniref:Helitron helicase-like domain-containing protein n=1 Tax=Mikania micrantha TaxID=192012 RepID=A0A5N6PYG9_9ASTR|nr:hypothetical protein E3N88_00561 [Mikania micrantha]